MSEFGLKILLKVLIPYTFGLFFIAMGIKQILKKESIVTNVIYVLVGLFLSLGAIVHLLFVADISMYI